MGEPKKFTICKFDPTVKDEPSDGALIEITDKLPEFVSCGLSEDIFEHQASDLAFALFSTLPQGTLDRLIVKLMEHKLSYYRGKTEG